MAAENGTTGATGAGAQSGATDFKGKGKAPANEQPADDTSMMDEDDDDDEEDPEEVRTKRAVASSI
jgi:hypothetical protein